jgi:enolase
MRTPTKSRLARERSARVSMAVARATAVALKRPLYEHLAVISGRAEKSYLLPVPMMNILNGGAHADSSVDLQEFMVMPVGCRRSPRHCARSRNLPRASRHS